MKMKSGLARVFQLTNQRKATLKKYNATLPHKAGSAVMMDAANSNMEWTHASWTSISAIVTASDVN